MRPINGLMNRKKPSVYPLKFFCHWVNEYLDSKDPKHRILFLVDEVGQFIGSDTRLMLTLQTLTENLGTICKGRAWIIVTSQADMDAVLGELSSSKANDFQKLPGRFKTRLSLSSSNTDEVIQKRLLRKTPEAATMLKSVFDQKGDILKNQITFDRSGPTLKKFRWSDSFVNNYRLRLTTSSWCRRCLKRSAKWGQPERTWLMVSAPCWMPSKWRPAPSPKKRLEPWCQCTVSTVLLKAFGYRRQTYDRSGG